MIAFYVKKLLCFRLFSSQSCDISTDEDDEVQRNEAVSGCDSGSAQGTAPQGLNH